MGKSKKDKKGRRGADSDSNDEAPGLDLLKTVTAVQPDGDEVANTTNSKSVSKQAKKKKKGKGKQIESDGSDEDGITSIGKLNISDDEDEDFPKLALKAKKKKAPAMKANVFQMLDMSDSDDDKADVISSDEAEQVKLVNTKKNTNINVLTNLSDNEIDDDNDSDAPSVPAPVAKKTKAKKAKKKAKVEEDDDIDAILASISYTNDPSNMSRDGKGTDIDKVCEMMDTAPVKISSTAVEDEETAETEDPALKLKAQKKKEKREKEKQRKKEQKGKLPESKSTDLKEVEATEPVKAETQKEDEDEKEPSPDAADEKDESETSKKKKKDKKKKTKEEKEEEEKGKKKPGKAKIKAMQEALAALKEREEQMDRDEKEREIREEEARLAKEEAERLEKEKKEKLKIKKKEREQRMKAEGKWLTDKQKADRRRALQMLEVMKQQGMEVPQVDQQETVEKKKRVVYEKKKKRPQQAKGTENNITPTSTPAETPVEAVTTETITEAFAAETKNLEEKVKEDVKVDHEEIKDDWAADSGDEEKRKAAVSSKEEKPKVVEEVKEQSSEEKDDESEEESEEEEEEEEEEESESESESSEEDPDEGLSYPEKVRQRATIRIQKRQEENEKKRTTDVLRSPVVCVLGHVDTGKTKILDKLRHTHVQDGEAGGITQQIGATNVPVAAIKEQTKMCKEFAKAELKLPGLLIIDTPGHESFSNLRSRGSSLCDIAILVVDIMHGLEPQTLESIQLLKKRKTPFVVALNKIDRLFQWKTNPHTDVHNTLKKQQKNTKDEFDERVKQIVLEFAHQSLNVTLFYENKNPKEWISMVPTSAHSGDGMGNIMSLICELSQTMLAKRLSFSDELQATVMEVKALPGLGTTIDVCLVNGTLREGQTIIVAGQEGPIVTQVRGLLIPPPMKELRVKNQYEKVKEMRAAHGVKIIAKDLEKALAGLPMYGCNHPDEVEIVREEVAIQLKNALNSIKLTERGVFVQASTLGSLEALLEFLKTSKIPYAGINIGPIHKKDVMRASVMLEHDVQFACILAFDIKVEREAQDLADSLGVRVFTADIIYHLFDQFTKYREDYKMKKKEEFRHIAVFPCKVRILPQYIFNSRDPIVMGVSVEGGVLRMGTPICVPSKDFVEIGRITSIEINNKPIETARKGQDVCVKIEPIPGEAPKMFGRHFEAEDPLTSSITRESIDAVKEYFRDDMQKTDWQLMIELKKMFKIS